jgi:anaerobic magnesium-protoporphyrin IX monomethyl ester cyclase
MAFADAVVRSESTVCLVHTPCPALDDDRLEPPLGLLYLGAVLRRRGHRVLLMDLSSRWNGGSDSPLPDGYDVYGFSTYSVSYPLTQRLQGIVRARNPDAWLVAGGPHATALPEQVSRDGFDVVVKGEGEIAMQEIVDALDHGCTPPKVLSAAAPEPLDALPFPDFDMVDRETYSRRVDGQPSLSLLSSRGCPFPCTFCNSNIMGAGKPLRFRSPKNVVAEIRRCKERYGIRHFRFQDDLFTINHRRVAALTSAIGPEDIVYRCFARVNTFDGDIARMLWDSGCRHVSFGVESGSPRILARHAMNKRQTPTQIRRALQHAHEAGLTTRIYLMVGFPGETDETVAETLALARVTPWDEFFVYPVIAYPGTPLHDRPQEFGITHILKEYSDYVQIGRDYRAGFTIRTDTFDEHRVREWRDHVIDELRADGRAWAGESVKFK